MKLLIATLLIVGSLSAMACGGAKNASVDSDDNPIVATAETNE